MERPRRDAAQAEGGEALGHLARRLVGERDDEDPPRVDRAGRDGVGDPVGHDARLARAGAGVDDQRPARDPDGLDLGRVEPVEERLGIAGHHSPGVVGAVVEIEPRWAASKATSSARSHAGMAPARDATRAPRAFPKWSAWATGLPRRSQPTNAAVKASPAPTVSTTSIATPAGRRHAVRGPGSRARGALRDADDLEAVARGGGAGEAREALRREVQGGRKHFDLPVVELEHRGLGQQLRDEGSRPAAVAEVDVVDPHRPRMGGEDRARRRANGREALGQRAEDDRRGREGGDRRQRRGAAADPLVGDGRADLVGRQTAAGEGDRDRARRRVGGHLHEIGPDVEAAELGERAPPQVVVADGREERGVAPQAAEVGRDVERRAPEAGPGREQVPQELADAQDARRRARVAGSGCHVSVAHVVPRSRPVCRACRRAPHPRVPPRAAPRRAPWELRTRDARLRLRPGRPAARLDRQR